MHSIPLTESLEKIDDKNLYVTPVTYTNVKESDTYKGGGGVNSLDDDENNSTEKPPRTVWTEK
jgi:hypothetical protein